MKDEPFSGILRNAARLLPLPEIVGRSCKNVFEQAGFPHLHAGWELRYNGEDFSLVRPGIVHDSLPGKVFSLEISMTYLAGHHSAEKYFFNRQFPKNASECHLVLDFFSQLLDSRLSEAVRRYLFSATLEMLADLLEQMGDCSDGRPALEIASAVLGYLEKYHYRPALTLTDASLYFGLSEQYLNRKFRQRYGCSIHAKLVDIRLRYAAELLKKGDYLVRDVARMTGWRSAFYFGNIFKRNYGVSPGQYAGKRNKHNRKTKKQSGIVEKVNL